MFSYSKKIKPVVPFTKIFKKVPPEILMNTLEKELPQTTAFILSFCKNTFYIKKAIKCIKDEEIREYIIHYLNNCNNKYFNPYIARIIERILEKFTEQYLNGFLSKDFRKNRTLKLKDFDKKKCELKVPPVTNKPLSQIERLNALDNLKQNKLQTSKSFPKNVTEQKVPPPFFSEWTLEGIKKAKKDGSLTPDEIDALLVGVE